MGFYALIALGLGIASVDGASLPALPTDGGSGPPDAGMADRTVAPGTAAATGSAASNASNSVSSLPLPPICDAGPPGRTVAGSEAGSTSTTVTAGSFSASKRGKTRPKGTKQLRGSLSDVLLETQNHLQGVARRYVQLLASRRFDEAGLLHEEEGGRRPDWASLRSAAGAFLDSHGAPRCIAQNLVTYVGSELTTFFFTGFFQDGSELPMRVAVDHWGHISGAGIGAEVIPATKKRYDRNDLYKTRTVLSLPFFGTWMASNATLAPGNGHYLNANQRFAIDFLIVGDSEAGKRKSYRDRGKQNTDYFAYGQDVLAPADGLIVQVVDGVPDNIPGQTDVYYRLGNSVVISFENGEYAHLCHLMPGSMRVRPGDRVLRGQVVAKCGNSGNSTGPHLHFQLTDGPQISHAASLPAYFRNVRKNGALAAEVLPQSGDWLENAPGGGVSAAKKPSD